MDRFWSKVDCSDSDGCWEWTASRQRQGYGQFKLDGRNRMAHRLAYELAVGPIPDGLQVNHHCDNPPCCNPMHLYVGTQSDNMQDRERRGRSPLCRVQHARGSRNGRSKLTAAQVAEIRARGDEVLNRQLAQEYGVSDVLIGQILRGEIWKEPV